MAIKMRHSMALALLCGLLRIYALELIFITWPKFSDLFN